MDGNQQTMRACDALQQLFDGPVPGIPDARIREVKTLPDHLPNSISIGPYTEAAPNALLFSVPDIARYLVRGGAEIEIAVVPGADRAAAKLFIETSARGTLIHQRGELPLNASTMVTPDGAGVAICGSVGCGKSSVAASLAKRGWSLIAEDVTRISWTGEFALAWPSASKLRLWRDACEFLQLYPNQLQPVRANLERYYVPVPAVKEPTRLGTIVVLRIAPECGAIKIAVGERLEFLAECTYRPRQIDAMGQRAAHARMLRHVSQSCDMILVEGAREHSTEELADVVRNAVSG